MTDSFSPPDKSDSPGRRAGLVAIVGRANVGKSTLLNAILGEKVSIVSPVAQTTRSMIRGLVSDTRGQLVFLDTPGVHRARYDLGRLMNMTARAAVEGVDVVLLVVDVAAGPRLEDQGWMTRLARQTASVVVALNKTDLVTSAPVGVGRGDRESEYRAAWHRAAEGCPSTPDPRWVRVSAATGLGVEDLVALLFSMVPEGPLLFPEDMLSDYPRKLAIADVVREKFFLVLREELPHCLAVCIETIQERPEGWTVSGEVYVNKDSQKGIVIGRKGALLAAVRRQAEGELSAVYERPVRIELRVKVRPNWSRDRVLLRKLGYLSD